MIFAVVNADKANRDFIAYLKEKINGWNKLLEHDQYKEIVVSTLRFMAEDQRMQRSPSTA